MFPSTQDPRQREAWNQSLNAKQKNPPMRKVRNLKGMGPNKACGHKGGISRQGSKRG